MIEISNISKSFGAIKALDNVSANVQGGCVFGLLGTNGAGKSTLLRILAGIYRPDSGTVLIDGQPVYEQPQQKARCFYISDEPYCFPNATAGELGGYYAQQYPAYSRQEYAELARQFGLDVERRVNTFSKGMRKQMMIALALASHADYIFCDETFDGLDPVMRQMVKSLFASAIAGRGLTPVIASHNLRELEDICDYVCLLHQGGLLLSRELEEMKSHAHKLQGVFETNLEPEDLPGLDVVSTRHSGRLTVMIVRGERERIEAAARQKQPLFMELLPLSLEEVFISETEVAGYEFRKLIY
ncbi:MAG: ABC transporter ATP-binding protein [Bacillota bacterium]|nr:ABC transporter ATP-binding protein [Bacillota bacterium]